MSPSKLTKYCACHAKWQPNIWQVRNDTSGGSGGRPGGNCCHDGWMSLLSAALAKTNKFAPSKVRSVPTCKRARPRALPKALPSTLASSGPVSLTRRRRGRPRPRRRLRRLPASASRAALKVSSQVLHQLRQGIRPRRAIPHHVYHAAQQCLPLWR